MHGDLGAPKGFSFHRVGRVRALVRVGDEAVLAPLADALRGGTPIPGGDSTRLRGRGAVVSAPLPGRAGERMVVRRYRHGGALRVLGSRILLGAGRPFAELRALAAALATGVPAVRPIAALSEPLAPGLSRGLIATAEEKGSVDLREALETGTFVRRSERRALAARLATAVRRLHDAGIFHADLHVKNVLVLDKREKGEKEADVVLVDFDRARLLGRPLPARLRYRNLFRLDRSLEKTRLAPGRVSRVDRIACLRSYLDPEGVGRLARAPGLKARLFWGRVGLAFHRLSWRLGGTSA